jgi:acetyltransferase EpsM
MSARKKLIIVGAGGAGAEALMVAQRMEGWEILGFADDAGVPEVKRAHPMRVLGSIDSVASQFAGGGAYIHLASGRNELRMRWALLFESRGFPAATLIDPSAALSDSAILGDGCYLAPFVFVGPDAAVGRHVLINTGASVGHDSIVGDYGQISPGGRLCGGAQLGIGAFVGSNGVVTPRVRVGAWSVVGAASLVARDLPDNFSAIGVPAVAVPRPPERK